MNNRVSIQAFHEIIDIITDEYHITKELRWEAKLRLVLSVSGCPRGCVRGIYCNHCQRWLFHCRVFCPLCPGMNWLVKGCRDRDCYGKDESHLTEEQKSIPVDSLRSETCRGLDRVSDEEVITIFPQDFLCAAHRNGVDQKIKMSTRTELLDSIKHAISKGKSFFGTTLAARDVFRKMGENELSSLIDEKFSSLKCNDERIEERLDSALELFCSADSPESKLFHLCIVFFTVLNVATPSPVSSSQQSVVNAAMDAATVVNTESYNPVNP